MIQQKVRNKKRPVFMLMQEESETCLPIVYKQTNKMWSLKSLAIVHKGVPDPPLFLRHPPLDPVCHSFLKYLFPVPCFLLHPLLR